MVDLPGSCGYSLFGDNSVGFYRDPEGFIASKIKECKSKIFQSRLLNKKTVFICSYEGTRELLEARWEDFEHGYHDFLYNVYGNNILFENGEAASYLRKCMMPVFSRTEQYNELITRTSDRFFDTFCTSGAHVANVYEEFKALMTKLCLELFLGFSDTSCEISKSIAELATLHWHGIISVPVNLKIPFAGETGWYKAVDAKKRLLDHIRQKICAQNERTSLSQSSAGVLQSLLNAPFKDVATEVEQHLLLFISALIPKAFSSIITSFVLEMAGESRRSLRQKALTDSEFHHRILLEVQRLWPPFFGGRRVATRDTVVGGFKVPKGYAAMYVSYFAQRDNTVFSDPDSFNPDRWLGFENSVAANVTFTYGRGPRQCIGHRLIEHILLHMTRALLEKFDWSVESDVDRHAYKMLPVARPAELPLVKFDIKK